MVNKTEKQKFDHKGSLNVLALSKNVQPHESLFNPVVLTEDLKFVLFKPNYHLGVLKYTHLSHHSNILMIFL